MKIILNIIKYIAIVICTCCIIAVVILNIASSTILNKEYMLEKLDEANYYEKIKEEIQNSFENYIGQSGLDESVIENIVTTEQIKKDTNTIINNLYDGTNVTINTEEIATNLKNNIETSLGGIKLTTTQQKAIEEYIAKIEAQYKETMSHTEYEGQINNVVRKVNTYKEQINKFSVIGIAVSVFIILACNYKNLLNTLAHVGISLTSSGLFYIIVRSFIDSKIKVSNILVLNNAVSDTIKNILNNILENILNTGIILFVIGILMIIIGNIITNIRAENRKEQE